MPKPLVIVESKTKADTIGRFLGRDYTVMASVGHIRDLPRKGLAIDVQNHFQPEYVISPEKTKVVGSLRQRAQGRRRALPRDGRGSRGRGDRVAPARGVEAEGGLPGQAHGVPRDHRGGDRGSDRASPRPRHEARRGAGRPAGPRPARGLRGLAGAVAPGGRRALRGPGPERGDPAGRRARARAHGLPRRGLLGPGRPVRGARRDVQRASRRARQPPRRDEPRLRSRHRRRSPRAPARCTCARPTRGELATAPPRRRLHGRLRGVEAVHRTAEAAVQDHDAAAGSRATSSASARAGRCRSRRASTSGATSPTCVPTR